MTQPALFDPGLQPERTELAWRRTALAVAIGSLLSLRVLPLALPTPLEAWGFLPGILGLLAACAIWIAAHRRQLRVTAVLTGTSHPTGASNDNTPGGLLLFAMAGLAAVFGVVALVFVTVSVLT